MEKLPSRMLWWGVGLALAGLMVELFAPNLALSIVDGSSSQSQLAADVVSITAGIIQRFVMPFGAALIAASLVVRYVGWRFRTITADGRSAPFQFSAKHDGGRN